VSVALATDRRGVLAAVAGLSLLCWGLSIWLMGAMHHAPGLWPLFAMWAAMMGGMMLPPEAPAVLRAPRPAAFVLAYLAPWMLFSFGAAGLQVWLVEAGWMGMHSGVLENRALAGALLIAAGALQFSPLKRSCREGLQHGGGLRAGALSVASCGVLMLVPFVTGVTNLAPMAGLTALLVLERIAPRNWPVSGVSGALLAAGGVWLAV
jgi:predicted metal-binding membrane protein